MYKKYTMYTIEFINTINTINTIKAQNHFKSSINTLFFIKLI